MGQVCLSEKLLVFGQVFVYVAISEHLGQTRRSVESVSSLSDDDRWFDVRCHSRQENDNKNTLTRKIVSDPDDDHELHPQDESAEKTPFISDDCECATGAKGRPTC